jgi:hypothetical protein
VWSRLASPLSWRAPPKKASGRRPMGPWLVPPPPSCLRPPLPRLPPRPAFFTTSLFAASFATAFLPLASLSAMAIVAAATSTTTWLGPLGPLSVVPASGAPPTVDGTWPSDQSRFYRGRSSSDDTSSSLVMTYACFYLPLLGAMVEREPPVSLVLPP